MKRNISKTVIVVFAVVALVVLGVQYLEYRTQAEAEVTATDASKLVDFVDGSSVELAPNSSIKYSNYFNEKGRFVELLSGAGNFTVVNEKGRFRIKTVREIVTVLESENPTVFSINFSESQTVIKVDEGKVNVRQNARKQGQTDMKSLKVIAGEEVISSDDRIELVLD
jgi:ferric-dicitrate binding protein FerR (iron transport regulator)